MSAVAPPVVRQHSFRALGTYVDLATTGDHEQATDFAVELLAEIDLACSRFRNDSDLSRANARSGRWTDVSPLLAAAVTVAVQAAHDSDGLIDPCLGRQLIEIGYDADLSIVQARQNGRALPVTAPRAGAWREIQVDPTGAVFVPAGVLLDLGATAKAWAADLIATTLADALGVDALVSLGGDIRIAGGGSHEWSIAVTERPDGDGEALPAEVITLDSGGVATSSTLVRRWVAGDVVQHHVLDPRTGRPAAPYWRTVTATGPSCVAANIASTAAIVLGAEAPLWLAARNVDARLVGAEGSLHRVGQWPAQPRKED